MNHFHKLSPLVTAIMITGMHKSRYSLARVAMDCFKNQTYPNKQLLIINHGEESLRPDDKRIWELRIKKKDGETVGDLRNLGLQHADGDFLISWDDDDWHHPKRIEIQMDARQEGAAVFLRNRTFYSFENGCGFYLMNSTGSCATILHPRNVDFRYQSLQRGSDKIFASHFRKRISIDNNPSLYFRFYHGLNLWDSRHIMGQFADPMRQNELRLIPKHRRLLAKILASYQVNGWHFFSPATKELIASVKPMLPAK